MKDYIQEFFRGDDGIETIEFVALIAVAAVLITVIANIAVKLKGKAEAGGKAIDTALNQGGLNIGGGEGNV